MKKVKNKDKPRGRSNDRKVGFSARLNELCDAAGVPEYGRASWIAKHCDFTRQTVHTWIRDDIIPTDSRLGKLVESLLQFVDGNHVPKYVHFWLVNGGDKDIDSPFADVDLSPLHLKSEIDHELLAKVYVSVHEISQDMGIDLAKIPKSEMKTIYDSLIADATQNGFSMQRQKLYVQTLLKMAVKLSTSVAQ